MPFNFNSSQNSLQLFGGGGIGGANSPFKIPRVGINFGNSLLGKGINFLFGKAPGDYVKGHPGSGGQSVGRGVRNLRTIFQPGVDTIQIKRWETYRSGNSADGQSSTRELYPAGFTPPYAFIQNPGDTYQPWRKFGDSTSISKEKGWIPYLERQSGPLAEENIGIQTISNSIKYRRDILNKRDPSTQEFIFGLNPNDKKYEINPKFGETSDAGQILDQGLQFEKNISLESWDSTLDENEDPTILGFDLEIDTITSPFFNGSCHDFIEAFSGLNRQNQVKDEMRGDISEIKSRPRILAEFHEQLFKFFKNNRAKETEQKIKDYYLEKISGLNKFGHVKSAESAEGGPKLFTNFPTDMVTISIREDVSQNISYLMYLYNILTRSRIEGRRIIPQNLLRFNCRIIVTEMRNYNRVMKVIGNSTNNLRDFGSSTGEKDSSYYVLSDLISKKEYNLYECEFFFNSLTHGDDITVGGQQLPSPVASVSLSFNYKFVSSEFHKFYFRGPQKDPEKLFEYFKFNDEYFNPRELTSQDTDRAVVKLPDSLDGFTNSSITFLDPINEVTIFDAYPKKGFYSESVEGDVLEKTKRRNLIGNFVGGLVNRLAGDVLRAGANALNQEIGKRFALVNKALNERLNRAGLSVSLNTIQNPRNIYNPGSNFRNELSNAIRGFVGRSVGRFFSKPVNTSEANNGYLPKRQGGPFRSSSVYRPTPGTNVNRFRATRLSRPRNVYTPRRVANFFGTTSPTDPRRGAASTRTARSNPFSL